MRHSLLAQAAQFLIGREFVPVVRAAAKFFYLTWSGEFGSGRILNCHADKKAHYDVGAGIEGRG
jgi:hypothetical protein